MDKQPTLAIASIIVGERRREQFGDLAGLSESIGKYGLFHPVVVDADNNLVAGERRLRACKALNWKDIPIRRLGELTPIELREIEVEENLRRKDLTAAEKSKLMVEYVEAAEKAAKEEAKREKPKRQLNGHGGQKTPGRPKGTSKPDSGKAIEERTGIPRKTAERAKAHVNAFTKYPFLERPHWNQSSALEAFKALEELPAKIRDRAAAMVDQPALPPDTAIVMLRTLAIMEPSERIALLDDYESGDEKRKSDAVCCAAQKPPMPDPRIVENEDILRRIAKAEKFGAAKEYATAREALESLQSKLKKEYERESKALARRRGT